MDILYMKINLQKKKKKKEKKKRRDICRVNFAVGNVLKGSVGSIPVFVYLLWPLETNKCKDNKNFPEHFSAH
jgi:hypothetical protein